MSDHRSKKPVGFSKGLTSYGDREFSVYLRRTFASSMGYSREMLDRPIVGIAHSASGFNNCNRHFPEMIEAIKRGVLAAGGLPIEFPTISLGETFLSPTSLKFRNLMSMDVEEMTRAQPMDSVVLLGGCDKTVPAQLMGAASANLPAVQLVAGPMSTSRHRGERLGACTDCRRFWARFRASEIDAQEIGNLAPRGAILKRSAADPKLFEKEGRAVVFESLEDLANRVDSDELDVSADDFLVLQNAGPTSESAMPEAGYLPIPAKLARAGVKDMVRMSDARMSGTAYGTIVLHITPDSASGGPLGLVRNGDRIRLSVANRSLELLVSDEELDRRRSALPPRTRAPAKRGYAKLYEQEILQADEGCDFQFLK